MDITAVTALFPDLTTVETDRTGSSRAGSCRMRQDTGLEFREIDVARVRLIHDLRRDMEIGEDAIPLVLSLLDQVYELRSRMNAVLRALEAQSEDVRVAVLDACSRVLQP